MDLAARRARVRERFPSPQEWLDAVHRSCMGAIADTRQLRLLSVLRPECWARSLSGSRSATMFRAWGVASLPILEMLGIESVRFRSGGSGADVQPHHALINRARLCTPRLGERETRSGAILGPAADGCRPPQRIVRGDEAGGQLALGNAHRRRGIVAVPVTGRCDVTRRNGNATGVYGHCVAAAQGLDGPVSSCGRAQCAGDGRCRRGGAAAGQRRRRTPLLRALSAAMLGHLAMRQPDRTLQLWLERPNRCNCSAATPDLELVIRMAQKRLGGRSVGLATDRPT